MKRYQNALLAEVAAIAIATSAGVASAQTHSGGSMGGGMSSGGAGAGDQLPATQAAPSPSGESGGMSQHPATGMQHRGTGSDSTGAGMRPQAQTHPGAADQSGQGEPQRHAQGAGTGKPSTAEFGIAYRQARSAGSRSRRRGPKERYRNGRPRRRPSYWCA